MGETRGYWVYSYLAKKLCFCADALKTAVRSFMKCLIQSEVDRRMLDTSDIINDLHGLNCMGIYQDCVDSLGSIVCALAWCFCVEERVSYGHFTCGYLFQEIIEKEIVSSKLSVEADFYFRLLMSFKMPLCVHIRVMLAKCFNLLDRVRATALN